MNPDSRTPNLSPNGLRQTYFANMAPFQAGTLLNPRFLWCALLPIGFVCLLFVPGAWASIGEIESKLGPGMHLLSQGKFGPAALELMNQAKRFEAKGEAEGQARALLLVAQALQGEGQFRKAAIVSDMTMNILKEHPNEILKARTLGEQGKIASAIGRKDEALKFLNDALTIARKEEHSTLIAGLLNSLGTVMTNLGRNSEALGAFTEAAVLAEMTDNPNLQVTALINSIWPALGQGLMVNARERLDLAKERSLELQDTKEKLYGLLNVGILYDELYTKPVKIQAETASTASPSREGSRGGKRGIQIEEGRAPAELQEIFVLPEIQEGQARELPKSNGAPTFESPYQEAFATFAAALKVAKAIGDTRGESYAWGYLGRLYEKTDQHTEAFSVTRQAIKTAQKGYAPEALYRWHWQLARLHQANENFDNAQKSYQHAILTLKPIRSEVSLARLAQNRSFRASIGPLFFGSANLSLQRAKATEDVEERSQYLQLARKTIETFKAAELEDYFQDNCVQQTESLGQTLKNGGQHTAIVYPILLKNRLEILVEYHDGLQQYTVQVPEATLTKTIRNFRQNLQDIFTNAYRKDAQQLYEWLIQPLEQDFTSREITTLVFVPDGALRTIPIAALSNGNQFLIQRYAVATTPGLQLTDPKPLDRENIKVLSLGVSEAVQGFPPLPYVKQELQDLQELYDGRLLLDQDFQVSKVKEEMQAGDFTIVHIASHGLVERQVEKSFLLAHDGKITMDKLAEIVGLFKFREHPLELLTLSACETAAGDDRAALGLAGVAVKSGARSALATLWFIDDQVASDLVGKFYRNLQDPSFSKAIALQQAQMAILDDPQYQHPNYWSPFLLINNWL